MSHKNIVLKLGEAQLILNEVRAKLVEEALFTGFAVGELQDFLVKLDGVYLQTQVIRKLVDTLLCTRKARDSIKSGE